MYKFIADSRSVKDIKIALVVNGAKRIPRKIKKKIKWIAKRASTFSILEEIAVDNNE